MSEIKTELKLSEVEDLYEDIVGYSIDDPGPLVIITDCELDDVGWVPKDKVAAITKILNWVPDALRTPGHSRLDKSVTTALIANTYEASVSVVEYESYADQLAKYGPVPEDTVPILDAEWDLVMYAPKEKAELYAKLFNWADANVPTPEEEDE